MSSPFHFLPVAITARRSTALVNRRHFSSSTPSLIRVPGPLVTPSWLKQFVLDDQGVAHRNIKVLASSTVPGGGDAEPDHTRERIPGSVLFDSVATKRSGQYALPTIEAFIDRCDKAGINNGDAVVVYDLCGVYSSPRVALTFEHFGYSNVAVLDGGLPMWRAKGFPTVTGAVDAPPEPHTPVELFKTRTTSMLAAFARVSEGIERPEAPSSATDPSKSLAWLLSEHGGLKRREVLKAAFELHGADLLAAMEGPRGIGVSDAMVTLAYRIAFPRTSSPPVFDGNRSEWARSVTGPQLREFSDLLLQVRDVLPYESPQWHAVDEMSFAAANLEFSAVYDFFEMVYRENDGLIALLSADNLILGAALDSARSVVQPPVSIQGEEGMTGAKRLGLGRRL